ncbi:FabD/lysophospholipase-like protein [Apiospora phragmitis]|uniref:FabD/lysophospholipase-like protein n=1 Tax=Apiospora phragmitis TaxID=2905665 RepID=A0ABR1SQW5_9PEZI
MNSMGSSSNPSPPLRILSLDGGGIRGKSSLLILENIMERVRESEGLDRVPRPCEYFDLIGGTSTGGIIAIMLGRLGMTVDECIRAYENVGRAAFTPKRKFLSIAPPKGAFSATSLEAAIRQVVRENCTELACVTQRSQGQPTADTCLHEDLRLRGATCTKTVVLAITKANVDTGPTLFTTYDSSTTFQDCTIWQVARATSAATTFFKSIELGRDKIEFIDAGFGYNNPCEVLIEEAEKQFPDRSRLHVLSIGTGLGDVVDIQDTRWSILKALKRMASSSTAVAKKLDRQYGDGGQYHRFNVERGLVDIALSDWQQTSKISAHTHNYLQEDENKRAIQRFVNGLLYDPRAQQSATDEPSGSSSSYPYYIIPFLQNRKFIGRSKVLELLQQKLFTSQDCRTLAILGLGGVGKTQVALEFAYWVKKSQPDCSIYWVPAYSQESFEKAYLDIAQKIGISVDIDKEDPKITLRNHLSSEGAGRWLWIVDNADDGNILSGPTGIYDYLPESETGVTIFTTRSPDLAQWIAQNDQILLDQMDKPEARSLLGNLLIRNDLLQDEALTGQLLKTLTYLPLAIVQAAAYINSMQHHHSPIKRYLELLQSTEGDLVSLMSAAFDDRRLYQKDQKAVATTWLVTFDQIQKEYHDAAELLLFISCIEPKDIPRSLLPSFGSEARMERALGTLSGYAFLESRNVEDIYGMHRLVHLATRVWIQQQARKEEVTVSTVRHVKLKFPSINPLNRQAWQICFPHAFRLLDESQAYQVEERYDLALKVGQCLFTDRRFKDAIKYLEEVSEWKEGCLVNEDPDRLSAAHWLASAYLDARRIPEAIAMLEHVVEVWKTTLDEKDHSRLTTEQVLASAYLSARRIPEAIAILEHVVEVRKTTLDEKDHSRLASEHSLATAYLSARRIPEAIAMLEHVVEVQKTTLDEKDHDRLTTEEVLATAYLSARRIPEAITMLEHVVEVRKTTLDEKDHSRLASEQVLAGAYLDARRIPEAIAMLEHVVEVQKTTLDEKDHSRLASEHSLATAYLSARRIPEAIAMLEHVVEVQKTTLDEKDHSRLASEHSLATAYLSARRIPEAIAMLEHVVEVRKTTLDEKDHSRLASEHSLATAYLSARRIPEAITILEHVIEVRKTTLDEKDHSRLASEQVLAGAYLDARRIPEAIAMLEHVVEVQKTTLDEKDHDRLASKHSLATAYLSARRIPEAIAMLEHVVEVQKTTLDEKDHSRLASEHSLATAYLSARRIPEAIAMLEHVVEVQKTTLDEKDHSRLASEHSLATAYLSARRIPEAIAMLEHVVEVRKTTLDEKDHSRLASEQVLASAYLSARRIPEAIAMLEHVVEVRKTTLDEKDHSRLASEQVLASAYLSARRIPEAIAMLEHVVENTRLATAYLSARRIPEAIAMLEHVVEVRKTTLDEKDHSRLASEQVLAGGYLNARQAQKAVDLLEHVVTVESQLFDEDDSDRHVSINLLEDARQQL